jgi:hypothetical protein
MKMFWSGIPPGYKAESHQLAENSCNVCVDPNMRDPYLNLTDDPLHRLGSSRPPSPRRPLTANLRRHHKSA